MARAGGNVTEADRLCADSLRERGRRSTAEYRRSRAAATTDPDTERPLPRLVARRGGLRRRGRPARPEAVRPSSRARCQATRVAPPRLLPHDHALPPRRADAGARPRERDALPERRLRPGLQPPLGPLRPVVGGPVLVAADRGRALSRRALPLRPREPRAGGAVPNGCRLALERRHLPRRARPGGRTGVRPWDMANAAP